MDKNLNISGLTCKELAEELLKTPNEKVWCGSWNGYVNTYAVVDRVLRFKYGQVMNDFYGTPGRMDKRLFNKEIKDDDEITYISTLFGHYPNPEIDLGDDNIDYPIKTLNGEDGDSDLLWKQNQFTNIGNGEWKRENPTEGWSLVYNTKTEFLELNNYRNEIKFIGKVIGIESLRNILKACKIKITLMI